MGFFSADKKVKTNTTTNTSNTQIGFQDVDGPAILGSNNVIMQSDAGAIAAGEGIAREALRAASDSSKDALGFGSSIAGDAFDLTDRASDRLAAGFNDALNFSNAAASREHSTLSDALDFGRATVSDQTSFAKDIFGQSLDAVTGVLKEGQAQLGNTVSNLNTIARQQSTSSDERIQQIAGTALKAVGIIAGLFVLGFILQRYVK